MKKPLSPAQVKARKYTSIFFLGLLLLGVAAWGVKWGLDKYEHDQEAAKLQEVKEIFAEMKTRFDSVDPELKWRTGVSCSLGSVKWQTPSSGCVAYLRRDVEVDSVEEAKAYIAKYDKFIRDGGLDGLATFDASGDLYPDLSNTSRSPYGRISFTLNANGAATGLTVYIDKLANSTTLKLSISY